MTASGFSAEEGALRAGADHVGNARTTLTTQINTLRDRLQGLEGQWRGSGATAFSSLMVTWEQQASRITGALEAFEANLTGTDTAYITQDDDVAAVSNNYSAGLG